MMYEAHAAATSGRICQDAADVVIHMHRIGDYEVVQVNVSQINHVHERLLAIHELQESGRVAEAKKELEYLIMEVEQYAKISILPGMARECPH